MQTAKLARIAEGLALTFDLRPNDSDPDGNPLTITKVSDGHGTATSRGAGTSLPTPRSSASAMQPRRTAGARYPLNEIEGVAAIELMTVPHNELGQL